MDLVAALAVACLGARRRRSRPNPLFAASDPIHIVIQAPLSTLVRNRSQDAVIQGR